MAGKGSAPRKGANQKAYEDNWEQIFGDKSENKKISKKLNKIIKSARIDKVINRTVGKVVDKNDSKR